MSEGYQQGATLWLIVKSKFSIWELVLTQQLRSIPYPNFPALCHDDTTFQGGTDYGEYHGTMVTQHDFVILDLKAVWWCHGVIAVSSLSKEHFPSPMRHAIQPVAECRVPGTCVLWPCIDTKRPWQGALSICTFMIQQCKSITKVITKKHCSKS